ncbi:hypothetical protein BD779DRAFT_1529225 [Infundibulicybe gibba]|nr:hypothetical protein BD779DRAFT_1529225 [Infundibulicybe gibba]
MLGVCSAAKFCACTFLSRHLICTPQPSPFVFRPPSRLPARILTYPLLAPVSVTTFLPCTFFTHSHNLTFSHIRLHTQGNQPL